ncbi:hypothetical protein K469DRAFT_642107 [Zopfia rhizophila CBS 207.26]|uniref:Guanine nucleotide-exchange factor SEC12 n=1 Tax=Zopfia rhizophila CBS 207.26 TaxID=1314779 RepID=A0A6A6DH56_9PEZI|nr:hypothetical protein K469DRAFT_642107 [Zopfia rhizophila CBS 207.26]
MSPSTISKAETKYPIFAATFAHNHPGCLVVGGGGGSGRSGVGNKITVFDVSSRAPILEPTAELELSRDEDSVTCLANLATKDGLILYAGINSSEEERLKDKNQHFRSFEVSYPKQKQRRSSSSKSAEKAPQAKLSFLSKTSLFKPFFSANAKAGGYQRLVRLSPPKRSASGGKRIGAIASGLAGEENEIVIFNATSNKPQNPGDIIQRISPPRGTEANDLDILESEDGHFKIAYCTDYDVFVLGLNYDFGRKRIQGKVHSPEKKYSVPYPDVFEKKGRFKIRCVRWLSPSHLLLLANLPNRTGVELQLLRIYGETMGSITLRKRLSRHVKAAVDMDVSWLDPDQNGAYQIVIAVAGIDISTSIFVMDYYGISTNSMSRIHSYTTFRDVHPFQMTKLIFSPFFSPWAAPQSGQAKKPGPQYLHLASTSLGNTISVDTFELQAVSSKRRSRYILSSPRARALYQSAFYFTIACVILAFAIMIQSLFDPEGHLTKGIVPDSMRNAANVFKPPGAWIDEARSAGSSAIPGAKAPVARTSHRIRDLLHLHHRESHEDGEKKAVVIHDDRTTDSSLSTEVHAGGEEVVKRYTEAKKWEELSHAERSRWKEKLVSAGMWAVEEGETILKGIFFSEAAGLVGHMVHG